MFQVRSRGWFSSRQVLQKVSPPEFTVSVSSWQNQLLLSVTDRQHRGLVFSFTAAPRTVLDDIKAAIL